MKSLGLKAGLLACVFANMTVAQKVDAEVDPEVRRALQKFGCKLYYYDVAFPPQTTDKDLAEMSAHLRKMPRLELSLQKTKVTDAGLKDLADLPNLKSLSLTQTAVSDKGLKDLRVPEGMFSLGLDRTKVTDEGVKELARMKGLTHVRLNETVVTDEGLKGLTGLSKLQSINLDRTKVTDRGLKHLQGLKNLKTITATNSGVTKAGASELLKFLPKCEVKYGTTGGTVVTP